jgi:hypothetical protein
MPISASRNGGKVIFRISRLRLCGIAFLTGSLVLSGAAQALSLGGDKDVSVKVTRGDELKGKSTIAIGAFRVAFVTQDAANASTQGLFGGSAAKVSGELVGADRALMQKIADQVYADFLKQATARGYTLIESSALAQAAPAYAALTPSENFMVGRSGTYVIPTGQRSVALASDSRAKEEKGTGGFSARFAIVGDQVAKAPSYDAFPVAAKEANAPVLGVTIVVNFANFKGSASLGGSKASLAVGATIDGRNKNEIIPSTSILGWDKGTGTCALCQAQFGLEGQIHSDEFIGKYDGSGAQNNQSGIVTVEPAAYEKNVLLVAAQAVELLLNAVAAQK